MHRYLRHVYIILILVGIYCLYRFTVNSIENANLIDAQYTALFKLRGDPRLDTATNRLLYKEQSEKIYTEIARLRNRSPIWLQIVSPIIGILTGWFIQKMLKSLSNIPTTPAG